jgi:hypothetical protein
MTLIESADSLHESLSSLDRFPMAEIGEYLQPPADVLREPEKGNTLLTVWRKKAGSSSSGN